MAGLLTPLPSNGPAIKRRTFFCGFPKTDLRKYTQRNIQQNVTGLKGKVLYLKKKFSKKLLHNIYKYQIYLLWREFKKGMSKN